MRKKPARTWLAGSRQSCRPFSICHRVTESQSHRVTESQRHRDTEIYEFNKYSEFQFQIYFLLFTCLVIAFYRFFSVISSVSLCLAEVPFLSLTLIYGQELPEQRSEFKLFYKFAD